MGQLGCPYNVAARAPQQVLCESQQEVPAPLKSPVLFHRLASFRLGGRTRAMTANGQAFRPTSVCQPLHTHYGWGSTNFSQCSHRQRMGLGRFLRFTAVGGTGPSSGQQTACTGQSWKSLACPLQMAVERTHYNSQTHWQVGLFEEGCVWAGGWVPLPSQGVETPYSPTSISIPPHPVSTWSCPVSIF